MNKFSVLEEKAIELGKLIRKKREEKNLSQGQLAYKTGINNADIHRIEAGQRKKINPFYLMALAEALDINYVELYKIAGYVEEKDLGKSELDLDNPIDMIKIPLYSSISAGCGDEFSEAEDFLNIPGIKKPEDCMAIRVNGDSMEPTIMNGTIIVIRKDVEVPDNKIGAFIVNNHSYLKRIKRLDKDTILLESDNENTPHVLVNRKTDEFFVCGRVIMVLQEF